jgi:hypothetical protein
MAGRILTFEKLQGVVTLSAIYGYQRGLSDAIMDRSASETSEAQGEVLSDTISALHVDTLLPKGLGPFHDDPTWDSFMQNVADYRSFINSMEE